MSSAPLPANDPLPPAAPPPAHHAPPAFAPPIPFWHQEHVVNIVSFGSSLALHLGLILIGFLGYKAYATVTENPVEQLIIPDAAIVENAPIGGIPNPGLGGDPEHSAAQDQIKDVTSVSDNFKQAHDDTLTQSLMGATSGEAASDSIIAPGLRTGIGHGPPNSAGGADGEKNYLPFGPTSTGGAHGPKANFIGVSGNARTVAYVCDASGSMLNLMFALKAELRKAIDPLRPIQAFNVIFFADKEKPQALSPTGQLLVANADNKRRAYEFLGSVTTAGATNPVPGLETAFKGKPQLVYLLTDGNFPDNNAVLSKIRELNVGKKTKINTILFCDASNIEKGIVELLKQIADENGGIFKVVDTKDY